MYRSVEMVSSITQDPYSIIISLNLASSVNLNIGAPPRPTELPTRDGARARPSTTTTTWLQPLNMWLVVSVSTVSRRETMLEIRYEVVEVLRYKGGVIN